jgi:hypothetical protein
MMRGIANGWQDMKLLDRKFSPARARRIDATIPVSYFTPTGLVAGSKNTGGENPLEVAWHNCAGSLDTDEVKLIHQLHGDTVYFIGAPAREFSNAPSSQITSPLALALKAIVEGCADIGIVSTSESGGHAAIVRKNGSLSVYTGSAEDCEKFIAVAGVELLAALPDDSREANLLPRWIGFNQSQSAETRRISSRLVGGLLAWSVLAAGTGMVCSVRVGHDVEKVANFRHKAEEAIRAAAFELKASGQKSESVLDEFQALTTMVVRAKGKVVKFRASDGRVINWKVEVPEYTPSNGYAGFGVEAAEKQDGKLYLSKGKDL